MKKLMIVLLLTGIVAGASAQHVRVGGSYHYVRPRVVVVGGGFAPYPYYGFGFGYYPFGFPYYPSYPYGPAYGYSRPSKMTMQIEDIKSDYKDKIKSAKHDKSLTRDERKEQVKALKEERDAKIADLKRNYYKQ